MLSQAASGDSLLNVFVSLPYEGLNVEETDNDKLEGLEQEIHVEVYTVRLRYTTS